MYTPASEVEQTYAMFSGRAHERIQGVRPGLISLDGANRTQQCVLEDFNEGGARIRVSDPDGLPEEFLLISRSEDFCAKAKVVWRRDTRLGLEFEERSSFNEASEMRRKLRQKLGVAEPEKRSWFGARKQAETKQKPAKKPKVSSKTRIFGKMTGELSLLGLTLKDEITSDSVKSAFRNKAMKAHPDRGGNAEAFKSLSAAYGKLSEACRSAGV